MTRWIAAAACALTLGLALPLGNVAEADGFRRAAPVPVEGTDAGYLGLRGSREMLLRPAAA
jgi:hypothetical protein